MSIYIATQIRVNIEQTVIEMFFFNFSVWDTTTSFAFVDKWSTHVVEHHNDLFSWKKDNNYTHMSILHEYRCKDIFKCGSELLMQKYTVLNLLAADSAMSHLEWVGSTFSTCFLHCYWVSTAVF
jgi:hypothetical protein